MLSECSTPKSLWIHTIDFVKSCINIVMRAVFVNNIKKHFDYSEILIIFATVNQINISIMLSFTILRSSKCGCGRCYIYNQNGVEVAQCVSMKEVFNYFFTWCEKMNCESVTYTRTSDKDVILAKIV